MATAGDNGSITVLKLSGSIVPAGVLSAHEVPFPSPLLPHGSGHGDSSRGGGESGVLSVRAFVPHCETNQSPLGRYSCISRPPYPVVLAIVVSCVVSYKALLVFGVFSVYLFLSLLGLVPVPPASDAWN